jgi:hypothetical protein
MLKTLERLVATGLDRGQGSTFRARLRVVYAVMLPFVIGTGLDFQIPITAGICAMSWVLVGVLVYRSIFCDKGLGSYGVLISAWSMYPTHSAPLRASTVRFACSRVSRITTLVIGDRRDAPGLTVIDRILPCGATNSRISSSVNQCGKFPQSPRPAPCRVLVHGG